MAVAVVCLNSQDNLVLVLRGELASQSLWRIITSRRICEAAVVILIPDDYDRVATLVPNPRGLDSLDEPLDGHVTLLDQSGIQSRLEAVAAGVCSAKRARAAFSMLVIALVGHDVGKRRNMAGRQVGIQT